METKLCECAAWGSMDCTIVMLTGHHEACPKRGAERKGWNNLVTQLVRGMESWASDEDGIHPDAWEAYRRAKAIMGEPTADEESP